MIVGERIVKIESPVIGNFFDFKIRQHRHGWWFVSEKHWAISGGFRQKGDCLDAAEAIDLGIPERMPTPDLDLWEDGECMFDRNGKLVSFEHDQVEADADFWSNFGSAIFNFSLDHLFQLLYRRDMCKIWLPTGALRAVKPLIETIPGWRKDIFKCEFLSWGTATSANA